MTERKLPYSDGWRPEYDILPDPYRWVCPCCGKTSRTRYGFAKDTTGKDVFTDESGTRIGSLGWDSSCVMHAVLCVPNTGAPALWRAVHHLDAT